MSIAAFEETYNEIKHTECFDPVRFAVIQGLHDRLKASPHSSNQVLLEKALSSIEKYKADFDCCRKDASLTLQEIKLLFPESFDSANVLFEKCDFPRLDHLFKRLKRNESSKERAVSLNGLSESMRAPLMVKKENAQSKSLDEALLNHEQTARIAAGCAQLKVNESDDGRFELQSMKGFREAKKYFNVDKIIARAINDFPENAGPHNPHMLMIKSLMHMRDLSPQYLRRFAGYAETILWLEKNSVKLNRKKTV